jgi:predicted transposase YbfD/YdcC
MTLRTCVDLSIFDQGKQISQEPLAIDPASLYQAFEKVKDRRGRKGTRYPLAFILTLILLGKMAGETKIEGIIDWINLRKEKIRKLLNWPKRFPSHKTYDYALAQCDHHEVAKAIAQVILAARSGEQCGDEPSRLLAQQVYGKENLIHTAVDGKVLRGTLKHGRDDQPPVHLLTFYECESGIVLDQFSVEKKENEYSRCLAILHPLLVKGRILTADAGIGYKEWCGVVHFMGGYYDIPIKDNNPAVRQDLILFFEDEGIDRSEFQYYKEVNKGHGRLETREIWTSTQMNGYFEKDWPGIAQVWMIKRTVKEKGEERIEIVYGITNLPRKKADAKRLLELNRKHWTIENRLHYRRDVTLGEDASQTRVKGAPQVLAALNGGILAFMDFFGVKNVAKQMRYFCEYPRPALQMIIGKLSRENG